VGAAERVERVEIRWPSGLRTTLIDPGMNRTHRVVEPAAPSGGPRPKASGGRLP
jgi:hypothetical protein